MKRNDIKDLQKLTIDELRVKEAELRQTLFSQRLNMATKPIKDNQSAYKLRKNIARVLTIMEQKNVAGKE